jgi:hypothetical protein
LSFYPKKNMFEGVPLIDTFYARYSTARRDSMVGQPNNSLLLTHGLLLPHPNLCFDSTSSTPHLLNRLDHLLPPLVAGPISGLPYRTALLYLPATIPLSPQTSLKTHPPQLWQSPCTETLTANANKPPQPKP